MIAFYFDDLQRWIYIHHHDVYLMKLFQSYFCIVLFCFMRVFFIQLGVQLLLLLLLLLYFMGYRFPFIHSFNFSHSFVFLLCKGL